MAWTSRKRPWNSRERNTTHPNVTYSVADAQKLTAISDGEFDVVVSFETIEHLDDVEAYLDEMKRILRPGGVFLVSTPDRRLASFWYWYLHHPANPYHAREYTESELLDLLSTRFQIKACYGQAFVPQWLVFWPVQYIIRVFRGIFNTARVRAFRDNLYTNGGNYEVVPKEPGTGGSKLLGHLLRPRGEIKRWIAGNKDYFDKRVFKIGSFAVFRFGPRRQHAFTVLR